MSPYVFALFIAIQSSSAQPAPQDEIKDGLNRAETLYYEARFNESIQLLSRLKPEKPQDRIATKLQLALANIGLNDTATAKALLGEIFAMDADYVLDPQQFSPKVIALANDAKNEQSKLRCQQAVDDVRKSLAAQDGQKILDLLRSMKPKCAELAQFEPDAADLFYKQGLADYKQGNFPSALRAFRSTLKFAPKHEFAAQYVDLTENKLQVAEDRLLLKWQKDFDARQYKDAAADYREIVALGDAGDSSKLGRVITEYRKALSPLVDNWNQVCSIGDSSAISEARNQIADFLPEPSFGADLRSKMDPCNPSEPAAPRVAAKIDAKPEPVAMKIVDRTPEPKTEAKTRSTATCFQMDPQSAIIRLKSRVDPQIPPEARSYVQNSQVTVRVKTRIDQNGNVTVIDTMGSNTIVNNAVRNAVERWKFSPAMDENGPRCVDTELSIVIGK